VKVRKSGKKCVGEAVNHNILRVTIRQVVLGMVDKSPGNECMSLNCPLKSWKQGCVCVCVCLQAVLDPIEPSAFGRDEVTQLTHRLCFSKYISFSFPFSPFFLSGHPVSSAEFPHGVTTVPSHNDNCLYFLRRLGSFNICKKLLQMFYQSVVAQRPLLCRGLLARKQQEEGRRSTGQTGEEGWLSGDRGRKKGPRTNCCPYWTTPTTHCTTPSPGRGVCSVADCCPSPAPPTVPLAIRLYNSS